MKKDKIVREGNARHLKYFRRTDNMQLVGKILLGTSAGFFLWTWFVLWSSFLFSLLYILLPLGFAMLVIGSIGKSSDEDIDGIISRLSAEAEIDLEQDTDIVRVQLKRPSLEVVCGYDYSDGLMLRKNKNGVVRSEIFKRAILIPTEKGLYVKCATVNIPCESVNKEMFMYHYKDIEQMLVTSEKKVLKFGKKSFYVKDCQFKIVSNGSTSLSLPAKESASLDQFIKDINKLKS